MNLPPMENNRTEEILSFLLTSELSQLHQRDICERIMSSNELSMTYMLFQSFLEQHSSDAARFDLTPMPDKNTRF